MVTITPDAIAWIEQRISGYEGTDWFVTISWKKGAADNRRTADGAVAWDIKPDEGWVVQLGGWERGKVPPEEGIPLCRNVRLLVQPQFAPEPFPGGEIYVGGNYLRVRTGAI